VVEKSHYTNKQNQNHNNSTKRNQQPYQTLQGEQKPEPLGCMYFWTFMPAPGCFHYYSFVVCFELMYFDGSSFVLSAQDCSGYSRSFVIPLQF
jgi:hypothetical protein